VARERTFADALQVSNEAAVLLSFAGGLAGPFQVLYFEPGDPIPQWFGHASFAVIDHRLKKARVYNYGMFSFGPDMLPKLLFHRL